MNQVFLKVQPNTSLSKTFRRRLIRLSHQGLICSLVGIALLSELVLAIPSTTKLQIVQQPVTTDPEAADAAAGKAFNEGMGLYKQGDKASLEQAIVKYQEALKLWGQVEDRRRERGNTLDNIGKVYADLGNSTEALEYYRQALELRIKGKLVGRQAATLIGIGKVYSDLGDSKQALKLYEQALEFYKKAPTNQSGQADALYNIGKVHSDLGDSTEALKSYNEAFPISKAVEDRRGQANILTGIGKVHSDLGNSTEALKFYNEAFPISKEVGDRRGQANILTGIGKVHSDLGDNIQALESYEQALHISEAVGDRRGQANILTNMGRVKHQQGKLIDARDKFNDAINIIEDLRAKITSPELRTTYFETKQDVYQLKIDVLMELHKENPSAGHNTEALKTTEQSRARSLIELLAESKADIRSGIEPKLLKRESDLNRDRNNLEIEKEELASIKDSDAAIANLDRQIDRLIKEQEELRTEISQRSPNYAALKFPIPLTFPEIQQKVLDDNTLILTYYLGAKRSYLWLVSKTEIHSFELPERSIIEEQAQKFYEEQKTNPERLETAKNHKIGAQLSQILLQPVANKLGTKRLLIVPDGALQYIPFAALPLCKDATCNKPSRLVTNNEIVNAPSISTIDIIRTPNPRKPTKTLAIIADPVFGTDDTRFVALVKLAKLKKDKLIPADPGFSADDTRRLAEELQSKLDTQQPKKSEDEPLERSARESGINLGRIFGTRTEANSILPLVPSDMQLKKFSFDANLEFVTTSPELREYRYISFATHGILNSRNPELSGLVLSTIDRQGKPLNGLLRLNDIFNLKLSADLVVLSACETGLGKEIKGEGLIGLTRGFMYAGAPRVVASLWKVSDDGTAKLMEKFYTKIFDKDNPSTPAKALHAAQVEMSQDKKYKDPYYWAGFTLQGEWREMETQSGK